MAQFTVPRIWEGSTCYIIGGGPSIAKLDLSKFRDKHTIAVNNSYRIAPWADVLYFMDNIWLKWHEESIKDFPGLVVSSAPAVKDRPNIKFLQRGKRRAFDDREGFITRGSNSGHGGMCLGALFGAKRIVLLGFDMKMVEGEHNYHDEHDREVPPSIYQDQFVRSFEFVKDYFKENNIEVLNATPGSALPTFPIVDPGEVM